MDLGLYENTEGSKSPEPIIADDSLLELAADHSTYSTEIKQSPKRPEGDNSASGKQTNSSANDNGNFLTLLGRKITIEATTKVDPSSTLVWEGNPRNFEVHDLDTSDLWPLIETTQGNTIPVYGRYVTIDGLSKLQIIAGSRRRSCCIKGNFLLLVQIVDCSDEEAQQLAEQENKGRKNTSFIADCRMYLAQFNTLKEKAAEKNARYTQQMYASLLGINLTTLQDYLAFAKFPDWLILAVKQQDSWSYRSCNLIRKAYNANRAKTESLCRKDNYATVHSLIKAIEHVPKQTSLKDEVIEKRFKVCGIKDAIVYTKCRKGTSIQISPMINQKLLNNIEDAIEAFAD